MNTEGLPEDWTMQFAPINHNEKMTTFVDPRMGGLPELPPQSNVPNDCHKDDLGPLPEGWESGKTLKCFPILDFYVLNLAFIEKFIH